MKTRIAPLVATLCVVAAIAGCSSHASRLSVGTTPDESQIIQRIILYGDGGKPKDAEKATKDTYNGIMTVSTLRDPILMALHDRASEAPKNTTVLFLGDNIYEKGMPPDPVKKKKESKKKIAERAHAKAALTAQIVAVRDPVSSDKSAATQGAQAVFMPGNHDRKNQQEGIDAQAAFIKNWEDHHPPKTALHPPSTKMPLYTLADGVSYKPAPGTWYETVDIGLVRVIVLDTGWILDQIECFGERRRDKLVASLNGAGDRDVLVVAHHPLLTHGPHGGYYGNPIKLEPFRLLGWKHFAEG